MSLFHFRDRLPQLHIRPLHRDEVMRRRDWVEVFCPQSTEPRQVVLNRFGGDDEVVHKRDAVELRVREPTPTNAADLQKRS